MEDFLKSESKSQKPKGSLQIFKQEELKKNKDKSHFKTFRFIIQSMHFYDNRVVLRIFQSMLFLHLHNFSTYFILFPASGF